MRCDGNSRIALRVPRRLDPLLRAIGEPPFPFPPGAGAPQKPSRCANVHFRTTPTDVQVYGEVTAIEGLAPEKPVPAPAELLDAFDVARADPTGKTAALRITGADVEAHGILLRTEGYSSGGEMRLQGPTLMLPLLTPQDRALARSLETPRGARVVVKIEGKQGISWPVVYKASFVSLVTAGTPQGGSLRGGRASLAAASLADDGEGRTLELSLSVVRARGPRLGVSVDGTVVELDLTVSPAKAEVAARLPSWPTRARAVVLLVSRDGSCRRAMQASCWAAELVDVR